MTTETVRRDLSALERIGLIRRVHGGAVPASSLAVIESGLTERDLANTAAKDLIAAAAVALLPPPGSIVRHRRRLHHRPARRPAPPRPPAHRRHPRGAGRRPARRAPPDRPATCCPAGSGRPPRPRSAPTRSPRSADLRADVAFVGDQRDLPPATGSPLPTATRPPPSAPSSAAGRRTVVLADSTKIGVETSVRFAAHRRHRRPGHRRRHQARRPEGPRRGRRGGGDRMILTLTPNPSIDRTVVAGRRADAAAQVQRADAVTSQGGGKGVNISRAAVSAGAADGRGAARGQGRPVRHRAAGAPASTAGRSGPPATSGSTSPSPSPTAPPPSSTAPAPPSTQAHLDAHVATRCSPRAGERRLGRAGRARCRPAPPPELVRRRRTPPARHRRQGRRRHQRGAAARRWSTRCPRPPAT